MGFDNTTENASDWQISIIENLIPLSYIPQQEKDEVERMIFDTLEKLLNPNYAADTRRNVNRLRSRTGQEYWWSP